MTKEKETKAQEAKKEKKWFENFEPYGHEILHKEMDMIQAIITRMSNLQMATKGMCIIILGFLFAITAHSHSNKLLLILVLMAISLLAVRACYRLDLNYLKVEKLYRAWFEFIVDKRSETKAWLYDLNPKTLTYEMGKSPFKGHQLEEIYKNAKKSWSLKLYKTLYVIVGLAYAPLISYAVFIQAPIIL